MTRPEWYSPKLARETVRRLYFRAKAEGIPMTVLVNQLVEEALGNKKPMAAKLHKPHRFRSASLKEIERSTR